MYRQKIKATAVFLLAKVLGLVFFFLSCDLLPRPISKLTLILPCPLCGYRILYVPSVQAVWIMGHFS